MTKEEVNIISDLFDIKAEIMKMISLSDDLKQLYQNNDVEAFKYQLGKKYAYLHAMKLITKEIDKLRHVESDDNLIHEINQIGN